MADGSGSDFGDLMAHSRKLPVEKFMSTFSPATIIRALENESPFACFYTAQKMKQIFQEINDESKETQKKILEYASYLMKGTLASTVCNLIGGDMPLSTARKELCVLTTRLLDAMPWVVVEFLECGICDKLLIWYQCHKDGERFRLELNDYGENFPTAFTYTQTDIIKPFSSTEECCAYAPRYAALCRESAFQLAATITRSATIMRCRNMLNATNLLVDQALNITLDLELPSSYSTFECAWALAVLVAPTLDDDLAKDTDTLAHNKKEDLLPVDPTDRLNVLDKLEKTTKLYSAHSIFDALHSLVYEDMNKFSLQVKQLHPHAVSIYGIETIQKITSTQSAMLSQVLHRLLTVNLLCDVLASILLDIQQDAAILKKRKKLVKLLISIHKENIFEKNLRAALPHINNNDEIDLKTLQQMQMKSIAIETDVSKKEIGNIYSADSYMIVAGLAIRALGENLHMKWDGLDTLAKQTKENANEFFRDQKFMQAARNYNRALRLTHTNELHGLLYSNIAEAHLRSGCPLRALTAAKRAHDLANPKAAKRLERAQKMMLQNNQKQTFADNCFDGPNELIRRLAPAVFFSESIDLESPFDDGKLRARQCIKSNDPSLVETEEDRRLYDTDIVHDPGAPPIIAAALQGNVRALKRCIRQGEDPNTRSMMTGETPLMLTCLYGHTEATKLLIRHGASTRIASYNGKTALDYAKEAKSAACSKQADENGLDAQQAQS